LDTEAREAFDAQRALSFDAVVFNKQRKSRTSKRRKALEDSPGPNALLDKGPVMLMNMRRRRKRSTGGSR